MRARKEILGACLAVSLIASVGCKKEYPEPNTSPSTPTSTVCGTFTIQNNANLETLEIYEDGSYRAEIGPGANGTLSFYDNGSHQINLYEGYSGDFLSNIQVNNACGQSQSWAFTDPYEAEMDIANKSWGWIDVYVDNVWYDSVDAGMTYAYPVREGTHRITMVNSYGGVLYDYNDYFVRRNAYLYNVNDPVCVTLNVDNETGEDVDVSLDGRFQDSLWSGYDMDLSFDVGNHRVSADSQHYSYLSSDYYSCGYYWLTLGQ